jgi:hypothetical protein
MTALTDFLLERIAEDEAAYRGAMHMGCVEERDDDLDVVIHNATCPNRVVAECRAKARLLERWTYADMCKGSEANDAYEQGLSDALRFLAEPYAGHPDYRQEWRLQITSS